MAARVRARLTDGEGRRFGLTLGGAFLLIASIAWWRERAVATAIAGGLSGALVLAALLVPTRLGPVERAWMALAHVLSRVTTPVVMAVLYFGLITPIGMLRRFFSGNPVVQREVEGGYWKPRPADQRRSNLERQF